jgi:hypothetical protein
MNTAQKILTVLFALIWSNPFRFLSPMGQQRSLRLAWHKDKMVRTGRVLHRSFLHPEKQ